MKLSIKCIAIFSFKTTLSVSASPYTPPYRVLISSFFTPSPSLSHYLLSSFFNPTSLYSLLLPSLTHLSLVPCCAKCLFICLSWVCLFGDCSEYILVKRQDKYQTVWKWSWQGKECHSYFTVYCATVLPMLWFLCLLCSTVYHSTSVHLFNLFLDIKFQ